MDEHARDCLVANYESIIEALVLPDADDRHVLAAAIIGHADVIITRNLRDFPDEVLERYGIEAQHPDEFIRHLLDLSLILVVDAVRDQQAALANPRVSMDELLGLFERLGLVETVIELRRAGLGAEDNPRTRRLLPFAKCSSCCWKPVPIPAGVTKIGDRAACILALARTRQNLAEPKVGSKTTPAHWARYTYQ